MRRILAAATVLLAAATSASADTYRKYFPIGDGDTWTYTQTHPTAKFAPWTVKITESSGDVARLSALPGVGGPLWVAWAGSTVYAWNPTLEEWVAFLRFGAPTGTVYTVSLGVEGFDGATIRVRSKSARVDSAALDRTFYDCVRFSFLRADGSPEEDYYYAPKVGLVRWVDPGSSGTLTGTVGAGVIGGHKLGPIAFTPLESGADTQATAVGTNDVRLFNAKAAWTSFYHQHRPGEPVPVIDFYHHTVLVALAGERPTAGYSLAVTTATWNFPYEGARVRVSETTPSGAAAPGVTHPLAIVVLDKKVYSVKVQWDVVAPPATSKARFVDDMRQWLVQRYAQYGDEIAESGGPTLAEAQAAVTEAIVVEIENAGDDPEGHDLAIYRVFALTEDPIHPGSGNTHYGVYKIDTAELVKIFIFG